MSRPHLIAPPVIEQPAGVPTDAVFFYGGRALKVTRVHGSDAAAPVIVEELSDLYTLKGQLAMWSHDAVVRILNNRAPARWRR